MIYFTEKQGVHAKDSPELACQETGRRIEQAARGKHFDRFEGFFMLFLQEELRIRCIAYSACRNHKPNWGLKVPFPLNGLKNESNPRNALFNQEVRVDQKRLFHFFSQTLNRLLL